MPSRITRMPVEPKEIAQRFEHVLPPVEQALLRLVAKEAEALSLPLYIIGGFVRDLFIGQAGLDFDLVTVGNAAKFARKLAHNYGGKITVHPQFETATWEPNLSKLEHTGIIASGEVKIQPLDFVTARSETYEYPGALPTVSPGSLEDDLNRRDFSINTLALRLDGTHYGELVDLLGGLEDIDKGLVRVLHPDSYLDDPTRILRAVRYEQRYDFKIAPADLGLIAAALPGIRRLSGERLRHELDLILDEDRSAPMLARLHELGVFMQVEPPLPWNEQLARWLQELDKPGVIPWGDIPHLHHYSRRAGLEYLVWLGGMKQDEIEQLAARLDFPASLRGALVALSLLRNDLLSLGEQKPSRVVERLEGVPLTAVYAAWMRSQGSSRQTIEAYLERWRFVKPQVDGNELIRRGLQPGPMFKTILWKLRAAWLDGEVKSGEEEQKLLENLINL